jgi:hypothetical protein
MICPCCKTGEVDPNKLTAFGNIVLYGGKKFRASELEIAGLTLAMSGAELRGDRNEREWVTKARKFLSEFQIPFKIVRITAKGNRGGKYTIIETAAN